MAHPTDLPTTSCSTPPLQLPASYVAEVVTLAYAATAHAAEGRTVDTAHAVVGAGTDAAGLLVPMTRGRDANTAWVVTTAVAPDTDTGEAHDTPARTPRAVLADVLENDRAERTATADRDAAELAQRSTMTHVDRLIDLAAQVTAGRTARTLDELTVEGAITAAERRALAADEAMGSLEQLLRTPSWPGTTPTRSCAPRPRPAASTVLPPRRRCCTTASRTPTPDGSPRT